MSGPPDNLGRRLASWRGRRALIVLMAGLALGLTACASIDPSPIPANIAPTPVPRPVSAEKPNPERKRLIEAFGPAEIRFAPPNVTVQFASASTT